MYYEVCFQVLFGIILLEFKFEPKESNQINPLDSALYFGKPEIFYFECHL